MPVSAAAYAALRISVRTLCTALVMVAVVCTRTDAQTLTASFVYPTDGSVNADLSQPIQWTTVEDVQAYYLYVGTTAGANDIVNSGEIHTTSYVASNVPAGQTLYGRIHAKVGGVWRFTQITFTAASLTATITYPANGATNADLSQAIQWTTVPNAQAYYLYVGTTAGANNVVNSGELQTTSYLAGGSVPSNQTLYARIYTKLGGVWRFTQITFTAGSLTATITYPANGATNADLSQPIQWTTVPNAQAYYLYVGTTAGSNNLVNSGEIQSTSYVAGTLPPSQTLYARIYTKVGGVWRFTQSTFSAASVGATITYPLNGATNVDMRQPIQWTSVPNMQAYYLYVGTTSGANDIVNTGEIQTTSRLVTNAPINQTLYARIYTKLGGVWRYSEITFSAAPNPAVLTYPANGATNADLSQPIQWTTVATAQAYYLYVGTSLGTNNVVNTGEIQTTSYLPASVPANQTLYARIYTKIGGAWRFSDTTFSAAPLAPTMTYPVNGATNVDVTQAFQWTTVANAQAYYLYVGTTAGANDLVNSGSIGSTSYVVTAALPSNQTLHVRIFAKVGGVWRSTSSTFTAALAYATLTYPGNGATNIDQTLPFTWTSIAGAQAYTLDIGTTPGARDLVYTGEIQQTWYAAPGLPSGQTLYATLHTLNGGIWRHVDYTFSALPVVPRFVAPLDGATNVDVSQTIQWSASSGAEGYWLRIGTTRGGSDVFDSGELGTGTTSITPTGLPSTAALYASVTAKVRGLWDHHTDIAFTGESSVLPSTIAVPTDGATAVDAKFPFEWQAVALARGYRLTVGTTLGSNNLHDSGEIHVTRRFVPGLPVGVPLYGRVYTYLAGTWYSTDFGFTVAANAMSPVQQIKTALWATNFVRTMAGDDNRPYEGTPLFEAIGYRFLAVCADYASVLLQALTEVNLQTSSRLLHLAFNTNFYDAHTLVEVLNADTNTWMIVDPTFNLVATKGSAWATAEDVRQATLDFDWGSIAYEFLGDAGDLYALTYYLDYPLLFANVFHEGQSPVAGQGTSPLPYLLQTTVPVTGPYRSYVVQCSGGATVQLSIDGVVVPVPCNGIDGLSPVFQGITIDAAPANTTTFDLFTVQRFVF